uniref:Uncharacterized protein n=1 Tax=Anguilla anguilla TaxID=7936 RepID=A0A0E9PVF2_ANGAN
MLVQSRPKSGMIKKDTVDTG